MVKDTQFNKFEFVVVNFMKMKNPMLVVISMDKSVEFIINSIWPPRHYGLWSKLNLNGWLIIEMDDTLHICVRSRDSLKVNTT